MARTCVFFFMGNHLGLVPLVLIVKKIGVETTFRFRGESSVKVKRSLESTCHKEERIG